MIVYVLTEEPYHDNSTILGVFATMEAAMAAAPANDTWHPGGVYSPDLEGAFVTDEDKGGTCWCIRPYPLDFDGQREGG